MQTTRTFSGLAGCLLVLLALLLLAGCERRSVDIGQAPEPGAESASPAPGISRTGGEWVVITTGAGRSGEKVASSWYLLRFRADSTVKLLWVMPGHFARERVAYSQVGDVITLRGAVDAPQVNGVAFTLGADQRMVASIPGAGGGDNLSFTHRSIGWPYVHWLLVFAGLTAAFMMWRQWKWFTPIVCGLGIVVMSFYWINESGVTSAFRWVKLYTLVVSIWFIWFLRYTPLHKYRWMRFLVAAILAVNILEAVEVDFKSGYMPNLLNGVAGILNILAITRWNAIGPNRTDVRDLVWPGQVVLWIIAYDIWNVTFSYLNFNEYTSSSIALNLVPTLIALWIPGVWVAARGTTLGFFYLYLFTFSVFVMEKGFVPIPINETWALLVASASFGINLVLCALVWNWKLFQRGPAWLSFGQYRHAERIDTVYDSIHVGLDKIPAMADYPPAKAQPDEANVSASAVR
ncbi:hypothetical protein HIV01_002635 [Lysobacter arenosi]|uniref:Uncharacterized protein n=1 Tax=Lysobacter arenosi TaxID=2795387 RepID=A0ABX7RBE5_9GAMM|nr:DUF5692 family protein [Lysobacter arenosi]QSX75457.1 hypothetical protein HIV01_002635 [Lysobacter arenosi]